MFDAKFCENMFDIKLTPVPNGRIRCQVVFCHQGVHLISKILDDLLERIILESVSVVKIALQRYKQNLVLLHPVILQILISLKNGPLLFYLLLQSFYSTLYISAL